MLQDLTPARHDRQDRKPQAKSAGTEFQISPLSWPENLQKPKVPLQRSGWCCLPEKPRSPECPLSAKRYLAWASPMKAREHRSRDWYPDNPGVSLSPVVPEKPWQVARGALHTLHREVHGLPLSLCPQLLVLCVDPRQQSPSPHDGCHVAWVMRGRRGHEAEINRLCGALVLTYPLWARPPPPGVQGPRQDPSSLQH